MPEKTESSKAPAANSSTSAQTAKEFEAMAVGEPQPGDGGNAEVQKNMDAVNERGYLGVKVDPTPNEHYTLKGAGAGKPTPETDPKQAAKAAEHAAKVRSGEVDATTATEDA
jgi:hypothetical protein